MKRVGLSRWEATAAHGLVLTITTTPRSGIEATPLTMDPLSLNHHLVLQAHGAATTGDRTLQEVQAGVTRTITRATMAQAGATLPIGAITTTIMAITVMARTGPGETTMEAVLGAKTMEEPTTLAEIIHGVGATTIIMGVASLDGLQPITMVSMEEGKIAGAITTITISMGTTKMDPVGVKTATTITVAHLGHPTTTMEALSPTTEVPLGGATIIPMEEALHGAIITEGPLGALAAALTTMATTRTEEALSQLLVRTTGALARTTATAIIVGLR